MISLKRIFIASTFMLTISSLSAQEQLQKIKDKNFVGEWYSKDTLQTKQNSVLTFLRNPDAKTKDSLTTYFKFNKNESLKIVRKKKAVPQQDTIMTTWFFVDGSKNIKVTEKIKTDGSLTYKASNGAQTNSSYFLTRTYTFHVDFISEEKLVLRYQDIH